MKPDSRKLTMLAALGGASLLLAQSLYAATAITVPNGGFDSRTNWSGSYLAGGNGGNGWTSGYFAGGHPTGTTFATTITSPLSQNLSGLDSTFVEGNTYTLTMQIFSVTSYISMSTALSWSLGLTAADGLVATDRWYSEEYSAYVPADHLTTVNSTSTGLKTVSLSYTATAADAGKVIGIRLADDWGATSGAPIPAGSPDPARYYSFMDNVTLSYTTAVPEPSTLALGAAGLLGLVLRRRRL